MPIEFAQRIRRIPVYPLAAGYDLEGVAMLASNETPFAPAAAVTEATRGLRFGKLRFIELLLLGEHAARAAALRPTEKQTWCRVKPSRRRFGRARSRVSPRTQEPVKILRHTKGLVQQAATGMAPQSD